MDEEIYNEAIHDLIDEWHDDEHESEIYDFLEVSKKDYCLWVEKKITSIKLGVSSDMIAAKAMELASKCV